MFQMLSTYYCLRLSQSDNNRYKGNGNNHNETAFQSVNKNSTNKCRVCLKAGNIPIYGGNGKPDVSKDLTTFGQIDLNEGDVHPKYLCATCYRWLKGAVLLRTTAKRSEDFLKNQLQKEDASDASEPEPEPLDTEYEQPKIIKKRKKSASDTVLNKYFSPVTEDYSDKDDPFMSKWRVPRIQCRLCSKIIAKTYFKDHLDVHSGLNKYICDICGKSFRQRCAYSTHYLIHRTDFVYKCKVCPYRANTSGLLKTHSLRHTREYRYMCTECPARFLTKSNLNRHMFKHKEPTLKCDSCPRAFHTRPSLERHIEANHLGLKKHVCNICDKAFGYRKAMMKHTLDVHKREKKLTGRVPLYLQIENKGQNSL